MNPEEQQQAPSFNEEVAVIIALLSLATQEVLLEIERTELLELTERDVKRILGIVDEEFKKVINESDNLIEGMVTAAILAGIMSSLSSSSTSIDDIKLTRMQKQLRNKVEADLKNAVRGIATTVRSRTENALRQAVSLSMRSKYGSSKSIIDVRNLAQKLKEEVINAVGVGYVDKAGRVWKPDTIATVVVKTRLADVYNEAVINQGIPEGKDYAIIVGPPAKDACQKWIGKVVKINPSAPGNYKTYEDLKASKECFHPNCRHRLLPITNPNEVNQGMASPETEIEGIIFG